MFANVFGFGKEVEPDSLLQIFINMITAKEFLRNKKKEIGLRSQSSPLGSEGNEIEAMIEFAKYHVKKALKTASEEAVYNGYNLASIEIDKYSILDAYPLENIK